MEPLISYNFKCEYIRDFTAERSLTTKGYLPGKIRFCSRGFYPEQSYNPSRVGTIGLGHVHVVLRLCRRAVGSRKHKVLVMGLTA